MLVLKAAKAVRNMIWKGLVGLLNTSTFVLKLTVGKDRKNELFLLFFFSFSWQYVYLTWGGKKTKKNNIV